VARLNHAAGGVAFVVSTAIGKVSCLCIFLVRMNTVLFCYVALFFCWAWCIQLYSYVSSRPVEPVLREVELFFLLRCFSQK
jgi:hypothetical protein